MSLIPDKDSSILITGGTGFLGSYILRLLLQKGYTNVNATCRTTSPYDLVNDIKGKINWIKVDMHNIHEVYDLVQSVDFVIHTAAKVSFKTSDEADLIKTNHGITKDLVNACLEHKTNKFIYISSIAALGRTDTETLIHENTEWKESPLNTNYAISKRLGELEVWRAAAEGLNVIVLNPALIIGAGYWNTGTASIFTKLNKGVAFYPKGSNGIVDVRDVASAVHKALVSNIVSERFIISSQNLPYKMFFSQIANALEVEPPSIEIGSKLKTIIKSLNKLGSLFKTELAPVSNTQLASLQSLSNYDNAKSIEKLGLVYKDINTSIEEIAHCFHSSKNQSFGILEI